MKSLNLYYAFFAAVLLLFTKNMALAQNAYIQTDIIKVRGVAAHQINSLPVGSKQTTYTYLNGLGSPVQNVQYQQSLNSNDIIQIYQYDQYGQQAISYLPYVDNTQNASGTYRTSAVTDVTSYYSNNSANNKVANDPLPFAQEIFENSPLHRLLAIGREGAGFQPDLQDNTEHFSVISYRNNTSADNVLISPATGSNTVYPANALAVTDTKDADGSEVLIFKNSQGQNLLKRQVSGQASEPYYDTYYVYNVNGSIAYVLPPKASRLIATGTNTNIAVAPLCNLIYAYTYDDLGRTIARKVPNTGLVSIVYDPMNRPVLVQDGNRAAANQWYYIKYDAASRPVSQGVYTDNTIKGQFDMQQYVNGHYGSNYYETRSSSATTFYYTNNCFPSQNIQQLEFDFYDDYDLTQVGSAYYSYRAQGLVNGNGSNIEATPTTFTQGKLTMVLKRTVGAGLGDIWLSKVYFYDKYNNVIQAQSNNQLNFSQYAVTDFKTVAPDFTGKMLQVKTSKTTGKSTSDVNSVLSSYTYDAQNERVQSISQAYNAQPPVTIATYSYNEIGQLVLKQLAGTANSNLPADLSLNSTYTGTNSFVATNSITLSDGFSAPAGSTLNLSIMHLALQNVDFRYNIRGELISINNSTLSSDNGVSNNDSNDLFGMQFLYDTTDPALPNTRPSYTGKVSAVKWSYKYNSNGSNSSTSNERSYVYSYDQLGQFTSASYAERAAGSPSTTAFNINTAGFDETGVTYDDDGNIITLNRNYSSNNGAGGTPLDNLTYTYDPNNPDQLYQVSDGITQTGTYGFNNIAGATTSSYYQYDANGNLTADPYKGIAISYNLIGRTDVITIPNVGNSTINYAYGDSRTLLKKQVIKGGTVQTTADYIDEFIYTNGTLSSFSMPEGRVVNVNGTLKPEYIISDQQGNARLSFQDNGSGLPVVIQENSYYGFGAVMPNSLVAANPATNNNNLYNGNSEWQNSLQNLPDYYETPARQYDPELGRFIGVDPLAESAVSLTNYHYAGNNPVTGNDPTGNCDPLFDAGCPLDPNLGLPRTVPEGSNDPNIQYGGGGAGDPGTDYSNNSVPNSPTSYGGTYNSNGQQLLDDSVVSEDGRFVFLHYGTPGMDGSALSDTYPDFLASNSSSDTEGGGGQGGNILFWPTPGTMATDFWQGFTDQGASDMGARSSLSGYMSAEATAVNLGLRASVRASGSSIASKAEVLTDALHAGVAGNALGVAGIGLTFYEDSQRKQGITTGTWAKGAVYGLEIAFPVAGLAYAIVDVGWGLATGKTITDRIGDGVDNVRIFPK